MDKNDHKEEPKNKEMKQLVQIDDPESPAEFSKVKYIDYLKDALIENL